jgi:hypothetical protein
MAGKVRPCEICMAEIPAERLETAPGTRLCTEHAKMIEKYGGEFITTVKQESLGKAGSLKKNYGGVTTERVRNRAAIEKLKDEIDRLRWEKKEQG